MRSSIACARCRRSKIKCVNAGIDTTCRACESSGRDCVYPAPAISIGGAAATKRDHGTLLEGEINGDPDGPKRQRPRKSVSSAVKDASKSALDALDSSILTVKVWEAVFDLFQSHYATLLPFLHPATFLGQIRQLSHHSQTSPLSNSTPQDGNRDHSQSPPLPKPELNPLIPLGVLALTARFHPQLVVYHSPSSAGNPSNPFVASELYANALRSRLAGPDGVNLAAPDLTRVQALLMLALHEWSMCRGKSAWLYVGMAIRMSQAMGLPFELENELPARDGPRSPGGFRTDPKEQTSDDVIAQETKRRTFWACFTLDRCLSSGKYRPRMIRAKKLGIQLPSDNAFAFGERVRTSRLNEPVMRRPQSFGAQGVQIPSIRQSLGGLGDEKLQTNGASDAMAWSPISRRKDSTEEEIDRWEIGAEESVLSRVIRITRVWGSIAKWSCSGRRAEQYPPWHPDSRFAKLRLMLNEFQDSLSRNLQYSPRNTDTHIMYKNTLASYMVMHVVFFLSVIVLHRANLPFLPMRCNEPVGPLDEPPFSEKTGTPDSFFRDSARELFKAGRQMMDLVLTCAERGMLVENPLVGFAVYNAALLGIYAAHFPHMDPEGMLGPKPGAAVSDHQGQVQARKGLDILREMRLRLKMARGWFRAVHRMHSYFTKVKKDMRRLSRSKYDVLSDAMEAQTNGTRGGEDFRLLEKVLADFGSVEDRLPDEDDGTINNIAAASDRATNASDTGSNAAVRSPTGETLMTDMPLDGASGRRESWIPINNSPLPLPVSDKERRPSLPLPPGRPLQSQSPYSLPSLQHHPHHHHPTPDGPIFNTTSSNLPSLGPAVQSPPQQYTPGPPGPGNRLQPLNSWLPSRQAPYSQSLPPINAAAPHSLPLLPPPGSVNHPTATAAAAASPPMTVDGADGVPSSLPSTNLGGDDVLAFLEGCDSDQWPVTMQSEGSGWLSTIWADLK
ncbi:putative C6 transcription factor [Aspergillus glaucus CBS 516.65]|uniref:Zn(2)-C6 fungal-type domain-containing protein n=1 Tax=Aspergillus glaucus CBS 516.65 TaxID=1160497 RepID=A0A1L9VW99_ASPGL|nr:hypothetical protein ASPGLDRAFT_32614 [Aspergillus glaucus CBS 516.65]OJJ88167.1 hypothetical protein ASPGLDRAFT_32614 [Aspergillus glaucus CBS 516.65]